MTPRLEARDPRIDRAISWFLATVATGALTWSIVSNGRLNDGIGGLRLDVVKLTTEMQGNSQRLGELKVTMGSLEERLRAVERIR